MRAYFFGNMYLSSIQQGIQAAHTVAEMFTNYYHDRDDDKWDMLQDWATTHKTMILLNAGYSEEIHDLLAFFDTPENPYPWESFNESEAALDGALTCIGIILPEKIYALSKEIRTNQYMLDVVTDSGRFSFVTERGVAEGHSITKWEMDLAQRLNNYGLAK